MPNVFFGRAVGKLNCIERYAPGFGFSRCRHVDDRGHVGKPRTRKRYRLFAFGQPYLKRIIRRIHRAVAARNRHRIARSIQTVFIRVRTRDFVHAVEFHRYIAVFGHGNRICDFTAVGNAARRILHTVIQYAFHAGALRLLRLQMRIQRYGFADKRRCGICTVCKRHALVRRRLRTVFDGSVYRAVHGGNGGFDCLRVRRIRKLGTREFAFVLPSGDTERLFFVCVPQPIPQFDVRMVIGIQRRIFRDADMRGFRMFSFARLYGNIKLTVVYRERHRVDIAVFFYRRIPIRIRNVIPVNKRITAARQSVLQKQYRKFVLHGQYHNTQNIGFVRSLHRQAGTSPTGIHVQIALDYKVGSRNAGKRFVLFAFRHGVRAAVGNVAVGKFQLGKLYVFTRVLAVLDDRARQDDVSETLAYQ